MEQSSRASDVDVNVLMSAFVALNLPVVFTVFTQMDQYGLFMVVKVRYLPLALSLLVNILLVFLTQRIYLWLRARDSFPTFRHREAFYRHLFTIGIPMAVAMLPGFLLGSNFGKPFYIIMGALITLALSITATFREEEVFISPEFASQCFYAAIAVVLVLLTLAIAFLFFFFSLNQTPPTGSFFWEWHIDWPGLGYTPEQFEERQRGAMLTFALSGVVYMAGVVGGSMIYAICGRMKEFRAQDAPRELAVSEAQDREHESFDANEDATDARLGSLPDWGAEVLKWLEWRDGGAQDYFVVFDGAEEVGITASQYDRLITYRENILSEADLLVDKAAADAYSKVEGRWERLVFRVRRGATPALSGPLSLLCVCARSPRHRFEAIYLRRRLGDEMRGSGTINVSDFRNQLKSRRVRLDDGRRVEAIPLEYDGRYTFIRDGVKVCFIYDK